MDLLVMVMIKMVTMTTIMMRMVMMMNDKLFYELVASSRLYMINRSALNNYFVVSLQIFICSVGCDSLWELFGSTGHTYLRLQPADYAGSYRPTTTWTIFEKLTMQDVSE